MKIVTDENIPLQSIEWLRAGGHEVTEARLPPLRTTDDGVLWTASQQARAILISTDKGFADRWTEPHWGVLVVRLRQPNRQRIHDRIVLAMQRRPTQDQSKGVLLVMRDQAQSTRQGPMPGDAA